MKLFRFLLDRSPRVLVLASLAGAVSGAASTGLLVVVNRALTAERDLTGLALPFLALCLLAPGSRVLAQYLLARLGQQVVLELRLALVGSILKTPLARLETLGAPRLMAALTEDIRLIMRGMIQLPALAVTGAIVVGCMAYMAWLSLPLFGVLLIVMAIGALSYHWPTSRSDRLFQRAREEQDVLFGHFRGLTEGIEELQIHRARSRDFVALVDEAGRRLYRSMVSAMTIFSVAASWGHLLFFVVIGVLLFVVPQLAGGSDADGLAATAASGPVLIGYTLTLLYMMTPLQGTLDTLPDLTQASVSLAKVERLGLALDSPVNKKEGGREPETASRASDVAPSWRRLELRGVRRTYPSDSGGNPFEIGPLDLSFEPGRTVFLVGGNGSGKTTFAKLLVGLYRPDEGEILLDGEAVGEGDLAAYRELFSIVFADPFLFPRLLGLRGEDLDQRAATHLAGMGIGDKLRVEGGVLSTTDLSRGQRKRLAMVIAYLEDRPIYVFDEWAADQDPAFRELFYREILPSLAERGKTLFVISHDDRYFDAADRILRFDYGRVIYDGPYAGSPYERVEARVV